MHDWSLALAITTLSITAIAIPACDDDAPVTPTTPVDAGTGSDASTGSPDSGTAPTTALGAGPYTIAYAGTLVGIDMRSVADGKATFDGAKLTGYEASEDERPLLGASQVNEASSDALVAIGRWSGGVTAGKFYDTASTGFLDLPANGGFHYAIGKYADPLPSNGAHTYTELAKTVATISGGSAAPGTITGTLAANLAGADSKIGFSLTLEAGGATYTLGTNGGVANVATSEVEFAKGNVKGAFYANLPLTSSGPACTDQCTGGVDGFVAGPDGDRIALVVHIYKSGGGSPETVSGAIVFKR